MPSCPPIFAKCARIASENFRWHRNLPSIAQCIGRAEQSCSRNDQICAVHDECAPMLLSIPARRLLPAICESRKLTVCLAIDHRFRACRNAERPMPHRHRAFLSLRPEESGYSMSLKTFSSPPCGTYCKPAALVIAVAPMGRPAGPAAQGRRAVRQSEPAVVRAADVDRDRHYLGGRAATEGRC